MNGHVIWDFNGTLFDDFVAIFEAFRLTIQRVGGREVTVQEYHDAHVRPFQKLYETFLGRPFPAEEYERESVLFWEHYSGVVRACGLRDDAQESISVLGRAGLTQSVLSLSHEALLMQMIRHAALDTSRLTFLQGFSEGDSNSKRHHIYSHIAGVEKRLGYELDRRRTMLIGDTVDDFEAAQHAGIGVVLVTGGQEGERKLRMTGAPVVHSLTQAVAICQRQLAAPSLEIAFG